MKSSLCLLCCLGLFGSGCLRDWVEPPHSNRAKDRPGGDRGIHDSIERLTSPDFFEHTEAARQLIEKGPSVIPELSSNDHLLRVSNDTVIPVCELVIRVMFTLEKEEWVRAQLESRNPRIREIAEAELERREKEREEESKSKDGTADERE